MRKYRHMRIAFVSKDDRDAVNADLAGATGEGLFGEDTFHVALCNIGGGPINYYSCDIVLTDRMRSIVVAHPDVEIVRAGTKRGRHRRAIKKKGLQRKKKVG